MPFDPIRYESDDVYRSWIENPFRFVEPNENNGMQGLRRPQLGALYTALAHLVSAAATPATIVMPTGTGKTDTIFALIFAGTFSRTLIIVPSDALRDQIANNIVELRNLRAMGAIHTDAKTPVIGKIKSRLSEAEVSELKSCNAIIATPQALQNFSPSELSALANLCSHLIIDEAHHVAAATWKSVRKLFLDKPSIQFTATPFREDKKSLDGKIIYHYSLKQAQLDGYFQEIEFHPIREYNPLLGDHAIASKAVELLRNDLDSGKDHLMMVRARSQAKATKLFEIYNEYSDIPCVLIHSKTPDKDNVLLKIKEKKYRIIVCVDMLGEGFDLPELKIAAIHDQHQSPAVTLQFIGRMTRVSTKLGTAKFVANIANQRMDSQMASLYEESADWSAIIRDVSETKIQREVQRDEFAAQFEDGSGKEILALNPEPNISAIAYRLSESDWLPINVEGFTAHKEELIFSSVNESKDLVILITKANVSVSWARTSEIENVEWFLYLAHYNKQKNTLFIHCSGDDKQSKKFRSLISRNSAIISGEKTFRTLHDINFLKLQNVGLSRNQKDIRFTMHVGRDINSIIGELENGTAIKSNIFATGFFNGEKATAGCSHKGKIWEMDSGPIDRWVNWCKHVAEKLNDDKIETKNIINNVMRSEQINNSWPTGLFYADWPESISIENEIKTWLIINGISYNLLDVNLSQPTRKSDSELEISMYTCNDSGVESVLGIVKIYLLKDDYRFVCDNTKISLDGERLLSEYLQNNPLRLLKQDGSVVYGNYRYYSPSTINILIPKSLISVWDWGSTKIHHESMGKERDLDTVQGFTYQKIIDKYDIIFNDDGAGEIADLIGICEQDGIIRIDLYHCKYCSSKGGVTTPGGRVNDTYEVSGQTSRSVKWMHSGEALLSQLMARYQKSITSGFDRVLKGAIVDIDLLRYKCRDHEMKLNFYIVQPAISENSITSEQLTVLGTSYTYIKSISGNDLRVIISK
ncbi:DEAD/DEAH box helicase [Janthinobacterium sp. P210005]|uniref:DEAD/DEAH box helicase n=1 Tax=Janthinobacterium sp. P210005 TaxID=3112938 RepID=UPI002E25ED35|nr:DEAD/DEAH box helicase family protein [Janthinobacterium sp. P210005]